MSSDIDQLIQLAKEKFSTLSQTDLQPLIKLCQNIVAGDVANFSDEGENNNEPANAANWPDKRKLPANWLIWLCTNRQTVELIPQAGLRVKGARIDGKLALDFATIPFPLSFEKCAVDEISLFDADIRLLNLEGTHTRSITASGLKTGYVFLNNGFKANGKVNLICAKISGGLDCSGGSFMGKFINPANGAVSADGMTVGCGLFMDKGFRAFGEVRLHGATIRGNFECSGGRFYNKGRKSLNAGGIRVEGNVNLDDGFRTNGEVVLIGAKISDSLKCNRGIFVNQNQDAISADRINVEGSVFMHEGFGAKGKVRLVGANIGSDLVCDGGQIQNKGNIALAADTIKVNGSVFLRKFKAEGEVRMMAARINVNFECSGCHLNNPTGFALNVERINVGGNVHFNEGFKIEGEVKMMGAVVGQYFLWSGLQSPETLVLNLQHAKVGTIFDEVKSWPQKGKLRLDGFVYDNIHHKSPISAKERLEWLHRQPDGKFLPQPFEQLAASLKNAGHEKASIDVLVAKNCDYTKHLKWSLAKLLNRFFYVFAGYGYRPSWAFSWSLPFILFGTIIFYSGHVNGLITPTKAEAYELKGSKIISVNYPVFNALVYSIENFVPLIKLQVADSYAPNANLGDLYKSSAPCFVPSFYITGGGLLRYYLWFHIIAGWFLTTLWVGGLTGLIRR